MGGKRRSRSIITIEDLTDPTTTEAPSTSPIPSTPDSTTTARTTKGRTPLPTKRKTAVPTEPETPPHPFTPLLSSKSDAKEKPIKRRRRGPTNPKGHSCHTCRAGHNKCVPQGPGLPCLLCVKRKLARNCNLVGDAGRGPQDPAYVSTPSPTPTLTSATTQSPAGYSDQSPAEFTSTPASIRSETHTLGRPLSSTLSDPHTSWSPSPTAASSQASDAARTQSPVLAPLPAPPSAQTRIPDTDTSSLTRALTPTPAPTSAPRSTSALTALRPLAPAPAPAPAADSSRTLAPILHPRTRSSARAVTLPTIANLLESPSPPRAPFSRQASVSAAASPNTQVFSAPSLSEEVVEVEPPCKDHPKGHRSLQEIAAAALEYLAILESDGGARGLEVK